MTPAAFDAQMEYLAQNGYHVMPLARLADFLAGKEPLPQKTVVITIDDGYRATYDIAFPILKKHGFPATVFLYSDFVGAGDAMTLGADEGDDRLRPDRHPAALEDARQPHAAAARTRPTRSIATACAAKWTRRSSCSSDRLADPSVTYAYPYGDVNEIVVDLLGARRA